MRNRTQPRVSLVTGSDRGIGLEVLRRLAGIGHTAVLTSPDMKRGKASTAELRRQRLNVVFHPLDVADDRSVKDLYRFILRRFRRLDVLVNNAGVMFELGHSRPEGILARRLKKLPPRADYGEGRQLLRTDIELIRATLEVNTFGALRLCQAFIPMMQVAGYGRIVNVSSRLGQLEGMTDDNTVSAYQLSKTALNAVTRMLAGDCAGTNVTVNSVCPGWTRTELGGAAASQSTRQAAETIIWLATQPDNGPNGEFFFEKKRIPW